MRTKQKNHSLAMRLAALGLTLVMIIPMLGSLGINAKAAATSLNGIENLKNTKRRLNILEIVPQGSSGSIGYYVDGQEPISNWTETLAGTSGTGARKDYANNTLLKNLQDRGLIGSDAANYPLTYQGAYDEIMPWELDQDDFDDFETGKLKTLNLVRVEQQTVNGAIEKNENGDYIWEPSHVFVPNGAGATLVENAVRYIYGQRIGESTEDTSYYYHVLFERAIITDANVETFLNVPLYVLVQETGLLPHYEYAGTLTEGGSFKIDDKINDGSGYFTARIDYTRPEPISTNREILLEVNLFNVDGTVNTAMVTSLRGQTLYTVETTAEGEITYTAVPVGEVFVPTAGVKYHTQNGARSYFAITDSSTPYREPVTGEVPYFKAVDAYRFVGNGAAGSVEYYNFTPNTSGAERYIKYSTVFYTGGYTNNEWFKRYVLDMDGMFDEFSISVDSVTPDMLTEKMIQNADMVVVSSGFNLADGGSTNYTADIKSSYYDEIILKPRVVDLTLSAAESLGENTMLSALKDGNSASGVTAENVYYFAPVTTVDGNKQAATLATNLFHTKFAGYEAATPNPYQVVVDEIEYENTLRSAAKEDPLSSDVSMATCFRYIINTHRTINKKTSLRVLDIQPVSKYDETGDTGPLTVATVLSWLPDNMQNQLEKADGTGHNITITHMSTNALVGKLEDISEEYDLIYVGAATSQADLESLDLFIGNANGTINDDYHYSNIGALAEVDNRKLGGLLDSEPAMSSSWSTIETRYSGNDLTPRKQAELKEFAEAGMPVVLANELVKVINPTDAGKSTLTVSYENKGTGNNVTAVPNLNPELPEEKYETSYEWTRWREERYLLFWTRWVVDTSFSSTDSTIAAQPGYRYSCAVTVTPINGTGGTAEGPVFMLGDTVTDIIEPASIEYNEATWVNRSPASGATASANANTGQIKVQPYLNGEAADIGNWALPSYTWYRETANGGREEVYDDSGTINLTNYPAGTYYCEISIWYNVIFSRTITSPKYKWTPAVTNSDVKLEYPDKLYGTTATIYNLGAGGSVSVKSSTVDPCSLMYEVLSSVVERENVMGETQLTMSGVSGADESAELRIMQQKEILTKYLNLSRPSITLISAPTEYGGNLTQLNTYDSGGYLSFDFQINNPTDATPVQTRYLCNLYIDQNGDGRHSEDERIYDFQIKEVIDSTTKAVENGELQGEQQDVKKTYRLTRQLKPSQFSGLVAWKLEVVKVGDSTAHASEKGYAYIKPDEPTPIKVLQIRNGSGSGANLKTDSSFTALYDEVRAAGMYDITVDTTSVTALNAMAQDAAFARLNSYEMIVLGFGDMYGDLDEDTARAVAQYIDTGKAVLFTHDTTSIWNREKTSSGSVWDWLTGWTNYRGYWGYHFNKIIRDKVGLDRYGVTNSSFQSMGVDAGTDGAITTDEAQALENAGYTVAYKPGFANTSAGETQGFSNLTVARYQMDPDGPGNTAIGKFLYNLPILGPIFEALFGGSDPITQATGATQVNKGHITEYPYTLGENLSIGTTHEQYYQLNMNAEDITVWYCLSGSNYDMFKNDTTNTYYIYNRGNITYSGAGHSSLSAAERKLFVNTMIAAYRAGNSAPTVDFKTVAGDSATVQLVPVEYSNASTTQGLSGQQYIYFEVQDTNLTSAKKVAVNLYYENLAPSATDTGDVELMGTEEGAVAPFVKAATIGTVYRADTGAVADVTDLRSGVLYRIAIPAEIQANFAGQSGVKELKVYLKAITTIEGVGTVPDSRYTGFDVLTLKTLGLLRLE